MSESTTTINSSSISSTAGTNAPRFHTKEWVAGCFGGVTQVLSGHPLDTIKVKLQTMSTNVGSAQFSISQVFRNIVHTKGIGGLYKGWTSPLIGACILNAVEFGVYNETKQYLKGNSGDVLPLWKIAAAGSLSGIAGSLVTTPTEFLKCNLQADTSHRFRGLTDLTKHLFRQHQTNSQYGNSLFGKLHSSFSFYRSINRGFAITTFRESGLAIYFAAYEATLRFLEDKSSLNHPQTIHSLIGGGAGGFAFWTIMFPIDLIKTRIQIESILEHSPKQSSETNFISSWGMAKRIYNERGLSGFYLGYKSAILRAIIVNAAVFATYEKVKEFL